jgi:hypothetical protein
MPARSNVGSTDSEGPTALGKTVAVPVLLPLLLAFVSL